jgi:DNA (cytosine-5)-methyltransferase 1
MSEKVYCLGELFCGPGGVGAGVHAAGVNHAGISYRVKHAWANDIDEDACKTYQMNFGRHAPNLRVVHGDVRTLDFKKLPRINALTFGFPCNDFSIVGEHRGLRGHYGPLYTYGVKAIEHFEPDWFMAENVGGLRSANGGNALASILAALKSAKPGYNVTPHYYKFEDYGVPQARHRVIIVGIKTSLGKTFKVPAPTSLGKPKTAREAIEVPPIPATAPNQELTKQSKIVKERLARISPGQNVWNADLPRRLQLNVKGARLSQIYKRLDPGLPAYTVTGSGGGGTHVYHWAEPRALTNRERARLQTFPDHHEFFGSKESARKQIGMAIPPDGVKVIVNAILSTLAGKSYPTIDSDWELALND